MGRVFLKYLVFIGLFLTTPLAKAAEALKIDDVSRLNEATVSAIIAPKEEKDIQSAIAAAMQSGKKVSIAGRKHSQGGHVMSDGAIVLDMTAYNKITGFDEVKQLLTVQSGATWEQVQEFLNEKGFAVKVQQSSNIFTVGGSLGVNAHGRDPRFGSIIETVESFRLITSSAQIITVSRIENPELFSLAIGGYGLFGVITEVTLSVTKNSVLQKETTTMDCKDYPTYLRDKVLGNKSIELHYARPNITKKNFMKSCAVTSYVTLADHPKKLTKLENEKLIETSKWLLELSRRSDWGKEARWFIQEELIDTPGKVEVITRNNAMRPPVHFLDYSGKDDTDILQEYFVPLASSYDFMKDLEEISVAENLNVLSITLRHVTPDRESSLPYANADGVAFVLYINHGRDEESLKRIKATTRKLIDAALNNGGTYYLTYANYATAEQARSSYPILDHFFEKKKQYDPQILFSNKFYEQYSR